MRRGWALVLLAACATERGAQPSDEGRPGAGQRTQLAELEEEIRALVQERGELGVLGIDFGDVAGATVERIEAAWDLPGEAGRFYRLEPAYGFLFLRARGETADVVQVGGGERWVHHYRRRDAGAPEPDVPATLRTPSGEEVPSAWAWYGTAPRAAFDRLARKVALVGAARLHRRGLDASHEATGRLLRTRRLSVRAGDGPRLESRLDPDDANATEDDAPAALIAALIWGEATRWATADAEDPEAIAPFLLEGLAAMPGSWQRADRVHALGHLGCDSAVPVLESMERAPDGAATQAAVALARIRLLGECRGATRAPARLVGMAEDVDHTVGWPLRGWALAVLAARFPDDCRALLYRAFETRDHVLRSVALRDLASYDPSDLTLARRACDDPDADLRVIGAYLLDDADRLLGIARDRTLRPRTRRAAIQALTALRYDQRPIGAGIEFWREWRSGSTYPIEGGWREPPGDRQVVGRALVALLDDPDVRSFAAQGLVDLGYREATPTLLAALRAGLADPRGSQVAAEMAVALGRLRAREAVEPLREVLERRGGSGYFKEHAVRALAMIGDPSTLPILERLVERNRPYPGMHAICAKSLAKLQAIARRDAPAILEGERSWPFIPCGAPRYVSELFAELFTVEELHDLARRVDPLDDRPVIERALELKEARE